ncbi:MAG: hypothetical protein ACO3DJ_20180, partial [Alphaproteobacteria bacterium]
MTLGPDTRLIDARGIDKTYATQAGDDVVALDASILSPPAIWEASGHLKNFTDPLVDCRSCHERFREDQLEDP